MIKFDFSTYVDVFLDKKKYDDYMSKKEIIIEKLNYSDMTGWIEKPNPEVINEIKNTAEYIKKNYETLVVIGTGGSFLSSYSFNKIFTKYFNDDKFEVIYAGTSLSSRYLDELLIYLNNKNFCINVVSKSGTTLETMIAYKLIKDLLKRKYSQEELKKRIIITTDKEKGILREEANTYGYKSFIVPDDIGGRYSFITPSHLLPLAVNYDIDEIIAGYYNGKRLIDYAYQYAVTRRTLFDKKRYVENICIYEDSLSAFTEWIKQLFGESEGKNGTGILPMATTNTRDLHSLGQFIQDGNEIIFETFIKVEKSSNYINYNNRSIHEINNIVEDSVIKAHFIGHNPCLEIKIESLTPYNIATLMYFFQLSAAFSAYLFDVNPFDQPGVDIYKKEVKQSLER